MNNTVEAKTPNENDWMAIDIYVFSNGQHNSPPRKYHLRSEELNWWDDTLNDLGKSLYGVVDSDLYLYTTAGRKIASPLELRDGAAYVAVQTPDSFIDAGYDKYLIKATRSWEKRQAKKTSPVDVTHSPKQGCYHNQPCCLCPEKEDTVTVQSARSVLVATEISTLRAPDETNVDSGLERTGQNGRWVSAYDPKTGEYIIRPAERESNDYGTRLDENNPRSAEQGCTPGEYGPLPDEYRRTLAEQGMPVEYGLVPVDERLPPAGYRRLSGEQVRAQSEYDRTSGNQGLNLRKNENIKVDQGHTQNEYNRSPGEQITSGKLGNPPVDKARATNEYGRPPGEQVRSLGESEYRSGEEDRTAGEYRRPAQEQFHSLGENGNLPGEQSSTHGEYRHPPNDDQVRTLGESGYPPGRQGGTPETPDEYQRTAGGQYNVLGAYKIAPVEQGRIPVDEIRPPGEQDRAPGEFDHTSTAQGRTQSEYVSSPGEQARTLGEFARTPVDQETAPGEYGHQPGEQVRTLGEVGGTLTNGQRNLNGYRRLQGEQVHTLGESEYTPDKQGGTLDEYQGGQAGQAGGQYLIAGEYKQTPIEQGRTPSDNRYTPGERDRAPGEYDHTSVDQRRTPSEYGRSPSEQARILGEFGLTPIEQGLTPGEYGHQPGAQVLTTGQGGLVHPIGENGKPPEMKGGIPGEYRHTSGGKGQVSGENGRPKGEQILSLGERRNEPEVQGGISGEDRRATDGKGQVSGKNGRPQGENNLPLGERGNEPKVQGRISGEDRRATDGKGQVSGENGRPKGEQILSLGERGNGPDVQGGISGEDTRTSGGKGQVSGKNGRPQGENNLPLGERGNGPDAQDGISGEDRRTTDGKGQVSGGNGLSQGEQILSVGERENGPDVQCGIPGEYRRTTDGKGQVLGEYARPQDKQIRSLGVNGRISDGQSGTPNEYGRPPGAQSRASSKYGPAGQRRINCSDQGNLNKSGEYKRTSGDRSRASGGQGRNLNEIGRTPEDEAGRTQSEYGRSQGQQRLELGRTSGEYGQNAGKQGHIPGENGRTPGKYVRKSGERGQQSGEHARKSVDSRRPPGDKRTTDDQKRLSSEQGRTPSERGRTSGARGRTFGPQGHIPGEYERSVGDVETKTDNRPINLSDFYPSPEKSGTKVRDMPEVILPDIERAHESIGRSNEPSYKPGENDRLGERGNGFSGIGGRVADIGDLVGEQGGKTGDHRGRLGDHGGKLSERDNFNRVSEVIMDRGNRYGGRLSEKPEKETECVTIPGGQDTVAENDGEQEDRANNGCKRNEPEATLADHGPGLNGGGATGFSYVTETQQYIRRSSMTSAPRNAPAVDNKRRWSGATNTSYKKPNPSLVSSASQRRSEDKKPVRNSRDESKKIVLKPPARSSNGAAAAYVGEKQKLLPKNSSKRSAPLAIPLPATGLDQTLIKGKATSLTKTVSNHKSLTTDSTAVENIIGDKEIIVVSTNLFRNQESEITSVKLESGGKPVLCCGRSPDETKQEIVRRQQSNILIPVNEEVQTCTEHFTEKNQSDPHGVTTSSHLTRTISSFKLTSPASSPRLDMVAGDVTPEENYIAIIKKGDVINLKLNIEIRSGDGTLNLNSKGGKKSSSLTNMAGAEVRSQISIDENLEVEAKSLQSLLNSDFRGTGFEGRPKAVVVQCASCERKPPGNKKKIVLSTNPQQVNAALQKPSCNSSSKPCCDQNVYPQDQKQSTTLLLKNTYSSSSTEAVTVREAPLPLPRREVGLFMATTNSTRQNDVGFIEFPGPRPRVMITEEMIPQCNSLRQSASQISGTHAGHVASRHSNSNTRTFPNSTDSFTQTEWCSVLLEARRHPDGRYSFYLPPLEVLRFYSYN